MRAESGMGWHKMGPLTSLPASLGALMVSLAVALGLVAALLSDGKHSFPEAAGVPDGEALYLPMWATLLCAAVFVVASLRIRLGDTRSLPAEAALLILSVAGGAVLIWLVLSAFLIAFFSPFVVGLGSRELDDIHAVFCFQFEEGCASAGDEFARVFSEYIFLIAGLPSVLFGGAAGFVACTSRWLRTFVS